MPSREGPRDPARSDELDHRPVGQRRERTEQPRASRLDATTERRGHMRRTSTRRLAGLAMAAILLAHLGLGYAQEQKTIRIALTGPIVTLDPANYRNRNTENVIRNMFDAL